MKKLYVGFGGLACLLMLIWQLRLMRTALMNSTSVVELYGDFYMLGISAIAFTLFGCVYLVNYSNVP